MAIRPYLGDKVYRDMDPTKAGAQYNRDLALYEQAEAAKQQVEALKKQTETLERINKENIQNNYNYTDTYSYANTRNKRKIESKSYKFEEGTPEYEKYKKLEAECNRLTYLAKDLETNVQNLISKIMCSIILAMMVFIFVFPQQTIILGLIGLSASMLLKKLIVSKAKSIRKQAKSIRIEKRDMLNNYIAEKEKEQEENKEQEDKKKKEAVETNKIENVKEVLQLEHPKRYKT